MDNRIVPCIIIFTLLIFPITVADAPSDGGKLHPDLAGRVTDVSSGQNGEMIRVIVIMAEQPDTTQFLSTHVPYDRKHHRAEVVSSLKRHAQNSQRSILTALEDRGRVAVLSVYAPSGLSMLLDLRLHRI